MPTYTLRSGITGCITEHGVAICSSSVAVPTEHVLTEAIAYFADSSGYTIGETVTEADTGVTGVVYWNDTGQDAVGLIDCSDEFTGGKTLTGGDSMTAKTSTSVDNLLEKTADTPRYTPILHTHSLTSAGVGDNQTVHLDERTRWVLIWHVAGADISVYNYDTNTLLHPILEHGYVGFRVQAKIEQLVLAFSAAGTCDVVESLEELP
jgi:hypothetical protein